MPKLIKVCEHFRSVCVTWLTDSGEKEKKNKKVLMDDFIMLQIFFALSLFIVADGRRGQSDAEENEEKRKMHLLKCTSFFLQESQVKVPKKKKIKKEQHSLDQGEKNQDDDEEKVAFSPFPASCSIFFKCLTLSF